MPLKLTDITDPINRGLIGGTFGLPMDLANLALNSLKAGYGVAGHKLGLLRADQLPQVTEKPFLGSEHLGDLMQRYGIVTPNRNHYAELAAGLLPLAPAALKMAYQAGQSTRPGRNIARVVGLRDADPLTVAREEILANVPKHGGSEMAVAVSPRGVAGPVSTGTASSVAPGVRSRLQRAPESETRDFHTHVADDKYSGIHPFDVKTASNRASATVVHVDSRGRPTVHAETVSRPGAIATDPTMWTGATPAQYRAHLRSEGVYDTTVPESLYGNAPYTSFSDLTPGTLNIIKEPGGNWLAGSSEKFVSPLRSSNTRQYAGEYPEDFAARQAVDNWIGNTLAKYVRNEMATVKDPIRLQAEAFPAQQAEQLAAKQAQIDKARADLRRAQTARGGIAEDMLTSSQARLRELNREKALIENRTGLHFDITEQNVPGMSMDAQAARMRAGAESVATNPLGRAWENLADVTIRSRPASEILRSAPSAAIDAEPWLRKVPPETRVHSARHYDDRLGNVTGFPHLVDELRNAAADLSELPAHLKIDYSDLSKMTVPQVVNRVDEINAWRAVNASETNRAIATNPATSMFKDYPGQGHKFVELKLNKEVEGGAAHLDDALKFEGDALAHSVAGYRQLSSGGHSSYGHGGWDALTDGRARIISLRDTGTEMPAVTFEVHRKSLPVSGEAFDKLSGAEKAQYSEYVRQWRRRNPDIEDLTDAHVERALLEGGVAPEYEITQIKGMKNSKPAEEYQSYINDLVRSTGWDIAGDLHHTNLIHIDPASDIAKALTDRGISFHKYVTQDELTELLRQTRNPPKDMAEGGSVSAPDYRAEAAKLEEKYNLPLGSFTGLVQQESSYNPNALSRAGAIGLAQLMPRTAKELGVDPNVPLQNLEGGARYLKQQLTRFGNLEHALAAYNSGPGNVTKHGGIPPFKETQNYVAKIMASLPPKPTELRPETEVWKAVPQSNIERLVASMGRKAEEAGRSVQESTGGVPVVGKLADILLAQPLQTTSEALKDYAGEPRDLSAPGASPYRKLFDTGSLNSLVDARATDLAQLVVPAGAAAAKGAKVLGKEALRALDEAYMTGQGFLGKVVAPSRPMHVVARVSDAQKQVRAYAEAHRILGTAEKSKQAAAASELYVPDRAAVKKLVDQLLASDRYLNMAEGGLVYNPARVDEIVSGVGYAKGGSVQYDARRVDDIANQFA